MKYLDTGLVIEVLVPGSLFYKDSIQLLRAVKAGSETVTLSVLNIAELFYILTERENYTVGYVKTFLEKLIAFKGLEITEVSNDVILPALALAEKYQIDFTDACSVLLMRRHNIKHIYAFDRHFDSFKNIQRLTQLPAKN